MFVQPLVETAHGRAVRLDDTLGSWFAVLGFGVDPAEYLTDAECGYLTRLGATLIKAIDSRAGRCQRSDTHQGTQVIEDLEGHLREWFTRYRTRFAVIRPDRYVAALADEASLGAAVSHLRTSLEPGAASARREVTAEERGGRLKPVTLRRAGSGGRSFTR
jgi:3-(3-hydroxy-phenyl)propionate hydroxylase